MPFSSRLIGRVRVAAIRRDEAIALIHKAIYDRSAALFSFCNAHTVNIARSSDSFASTLADHVLLPDGIGMDIGSRILFGHPFPENLNGTDFTPDLLRATKRPLNVYLLGSPPGVADLAGVGIEREFPGVKIVGTHDGFFEDARSQEIVFAIRRANAELVIVGMGQPRQEIWASTYGPATRAVVLSVGAYLDFVAGRFPRAPKWMRLIRIEWIYRLLQEPRRMASRYLVGNGAFVMACWKQKVFGR